MLQLSQTSTRSFLYLLFLVTTAGGLLAGCGGDGNSDRPATGNNREQPRDPSPEPPDDEGEDDAPTPVDPTPLNRYGFANGCYTLQSQGNFLQADNDAQRYQTTRDASEATAFYMKPTALGSYLLLSD